MAKNKSKSTENISKSEKIQSVLEDIKSKFGDESMMKLGDVKKVDIKAYSTGSISLDRALGIGGIPQGRIVEIYGPESSGKTTICLQVVANAQKEGGVAAFIDTEHALDPEYAKKLKVNTDDLLISQPNTGEEALSIVEALVQSGNVDIIVLDSVAAIVPKAEIEGEMGDSHVAIQARLMSQALRKLTAISAKANTTILFTNQTRMKIGAMGYGSPVETPGGKALKFYASVRIEIKRVAQIKKGEEVIGARTKAKIVKNKVAAPFKVAEFDIMYNEGVSLETDLINLALKVGILKKKGTYIQDLEGNTLGQGLESARKSLRDNPEILDKLYTEVLAKEDASIATEDGEDDLVANTVEE
ncbi:recombinase RecA [bacterium]|nr:recombinase RecA [Candidatus Elulimicrobium humile]